MSERDKLIEYLRTNVDEEFDPEQDNLLDFMDSVSLMQLVVFIEQDLSIQLDMSMMGLEAFASVDALLAALTGEAEVA